MFYLTERLNTVEIEIRVRSVISRRRMWARAVSASLSMSASLGYTLTVMNLLLEHALRESHTSTETSVPSTELQTNYKYNMMAFSSLHLIRDSLRHFEVCY